MYVYKKIYNFLHTNDNYGPNTAPRENVKIIKNKKKKKEQIMLG